MKRSRDKVEPSTKFKSVSSYGIAMASGSKPPPPGARLLVRDSDYRLNRRRHRRSRGRLAARSRPPALTKGSGNAIVVASGIRRYRKDLSDVAVWIQVTPLGLDAFADSSDLTAWVTDLRYRGKLVEGATVELLFTHQEDRQNGRRTVSRASSLLRSPARLSARSRGTARR